MEWVFNCRRLIMLKWLIDLFNKWFAKKVEVINDLADRLTEKE